MYMYIDEGVTKFLTECKNSTHVFRSYFDVSYLFQELYVSKYSFEIYISCYELAVQARSAMHIPGFTGDKLTSMNHTHDINEQMLIQICSLFWYFLLKSWHESHFEMQRQHTLQSYIPMSN